ncbi:hypothetical protein B0T20DRAFT_412583 [Sordaria brevicollis]|uniref:Uncharacterized protein n=1 Tax=Sordaria brevicollis TaxID=83679 RepID=A0AAE0UB06_SORBR|nr:hypothetical protein B0T20DRAFT_412583 [Sordaria brevicollis]
MLHLILHLWSFLLYRKRRWMFYTRSRLRFALGLISAIGTLDVAFGICTHVCLLPFEPLVELMLVNSDFTKAYQHSPQRLEKTNAKTLEITRAVASIPFLGLGKAKR